MDELIITKEKIDEFKKHLHLEEKSENTIEKYMRDIKAFWQYAGTQVITKELAIAYKENLLSNVRFSYIICNRCKNSIVKVLP